MSHRGLPPRNSTTGFPPNATKKPPPTPLARVRVFRRLSSHWTLHGFGDRCSPVPEQGEEISATDLRWPKAPSDWPAKSEGPNAPASTPTSADPPAPGGSGRLARTRLARAHERQSRHRSHSGPVPYGVGGPIRGTSAPCRPRDCWCSWLLIAFADWGTVAERPGGVRAVRRLHRARRADADRDRPARKRRYGHGLDRLRVRGAARVRRRSGDRGLRRRLGRVRHREQVAGWRG